MNPTSPLNKSIAIPIQNSKSFAQTHIFDYTISTVHDFALHEFKTIIYCNHENDDLDLNKYEVIAYNQKLAMHTHIEAIRYICMIFANREIGS
jgi:hypothetical protein